MLKSLVTPQAMNEGWFGSFLGNQNQNGNGDRDRDRGENSGRAPGSPVFGAGRGRGNGNNGNGRRSGHYHTRSGPGGYNRERSYQATTSVPSLGNLPESKHLTGPENYAQWRFLMKALLMAEGTWGVVEGSEANPEKENRAFSKICLNVGGQVPNLLYGITSAKGLWDKLATSYSESGLVLRCSLMKALFRSTLDQFSSMGDYLDHIMQLQQRLIAMKHGVNDQDLAIIILSNLTEEYDPIVMTLESDEANLTSDKVRTRLLQHSLHKTSSVGDANSCAIACSSKRQFQRPTSGQQSSKQVVCFNCNKPGHKRPGCPDLKQNKKGKGKQARAHVAEVESQENSSQEAQIAVVSTIPQADSEELA